MAESNETLRDLIHPNGKHKEAQKWERLRSALAEGLSVDESEYCAVERESFKLRGRRRVRLES